MPKISKIENLKENDDVSFNLDPIDDEDLAEAIDEAHLVGSNEWTGWKMVALIGLSVNAAIVVLGLIGYLLWKVKRKIELSSADKIEAKVDGEVSVYQPEENRAE